MCAGQPLTRTPALPLCANASHSACMWEKHSTPTLRVTGSSPSWVNSAPYFCREDMQNLMELITCVQGRERLLDFKEQIRPSKWLPSLNAAYLLTRPDHHVNSDSKPLTSVTTWMRLLLATPVSSQSQCSPGEKRVIPAFCSCISNTLVSHFCPETQLLYLHDVVQGAWGAGAPGGL